MLRLRFKLCSFPSTLSFLSLSTVGEQSFKVDKAALKELRSRTGYSYVNCRKAICQFGNDRLGEAEKWLRDMAEKEGWDRATKLKSRKTQQGLVSAIAQGNRAAMVRVYCETDFVARGERFKDLVEKITVASLKSAKAFEPREGEQISVAQKDFESLELIDGKSAQNVLKEIVNEVGENMVIPPVTLIASQPEVTLWSYAHPPGKCLPVKNDSKKAVHMGTFASVVGLEGRTKDGFPLETLGRQLCQQIIGMKATTVGLPPDPDKIAVESEEGIPNDSQSESDEQVYVTQIDEKETALLRQSFMLNPAQTVHDYISEHNVKVINFYRTEIGESIEMAKGDGL